MPIIDTHSHIFLEEFDADRQGVVERAAKAGINYHIFPNIDSSTSDRLLKISGESKNFYPLMGLHPTSVNSNLEEELKHVEKMLSTNTFWGIGEIGMDLYWDKTYIEQQKVAFSHQLKLAKKFKLPVAIHARNAFAEIFEIVDSEIDENLRGVFHCFTGTIDDYKRIAEYKTFKVGIGGVVTYKNGGVDKLLPYMDTSLLLLETDSPYLSPVPMRGKRNEPFNLTYIVAKIVEVLGYSEQKVKEITFANAVELFNLPIM